MVKVFCPNAYHQGHGQAEGGKRGGTSGSSPEVTVLRHPQAVSTSKALHPFSLLCHRLVCFFILFFFSDAGYLYTFLCSVNKLIKEKYPEIFKKIEEGGLSDLAYLLDFQGLGNAVAIGQGAADGVHIDPGDSRWTHAIIFSAGTAIVYFCIPQLHLRIPLLPGQCLTFPARLLSHYAYVIEGTGERILFNFFTDDHSVAKAVKEFALDLATAHAV